MKNYERSLYRQLEETIEEKDKLKNGAEEYISKWEIDVKAAASAGSQC